MLIELEVTRLLRKAVRFELLCFGYDSATFHRRSDGWYVEGYWFARDLKSAYASLRLAAAHV